MKRVRNILSLLLDVLLPRPHDIVRVDDLSVEDIAQHVRSRITLGDEGMLAPLSYRIPTVRHTIRAAKFYQHEHAPTLLGKALAGFVAEELAERRLYGSFHDPVFIPMPLHPHRFRERGFNQAERITRVLAQSVAEQPYPVVTDALIRARNTTSQATLSKQERYTNMQNAFVVHRAPAIAKKDIVLVDDVVTTGATMQSAKEALLKAGARSVLCVAVAH